MNDKPPGTVTSSVAHELRGPLTVILGWTNILLDPKYPADEATLAKGLAAIRRAAAAQDQLITRLLDARSD